MFHNTQLLSLSSLLVLIPVANGQSSFTCPAGQTFNSNGEFSIATVGVPAAAFSTCGEWIDTTDQANCDTILDDIFKEELLNFAAKGKPIPSRLMRPTTSLMVVRLLSTRGLFLRVWWGES